MSEANPPYTKLPDIDLLVRRIMEAGQKVLAKLSNVGVRWLPGKKMLVEVTVSWPSRLRICRGRRGAGHSSRNEKILGILGAFPGGVTGRRSSSGMERTHQCLEGMPLGKIE